MLYKIGRFLQLVGLIVVPVAIAGNIATEPPPLKLWTSLTLSGIGVLIFFLGYLLQQAGRRG